jgi:hypothetical protein
LSSGLHCSQQSSSGGGAAAGGASSSRSLGRWISHRVSSSGASGQTGYMPGAAASASPSPQPGGGPGSTASSGKHGFVQRSLTAVSPFIPGGGGGGAGPSVDDGGAGGRSSFRPVKTDDGEYVVWVECFSLVFRCVHLHGGGGRG